MATTFTPTAPTFTQILAATSFSSSATPNTTYVLDLTVKFNAKLFFRIGRNVGTALTRSAYFAVRPTGNASYMIPATTYDFNSSTAAVNATTVSSGGASGATTMVLASGTGYAAGQICCTQLAGARCEFFGITDLTSATITIDRSTGFYTSHNASDVVTNGADVGWIVLPQGDKYEITPINNSGYTVIMACDASIYASDTGA